MNEHELSLGLRAIHHERADVADVQAVRQHVLAAPIEGLPQRWSWLSRIDIGGYTVFSAVKFLAAAAIVALFGGFLLTGVLTTPQGDEMAPAAVTESPSPMTTEDLLAGHGHRGSRAGSTAGRRATACGTSRSVKADGHRRRLRRRHRGSCERIGKFLRLAGDGTRPELPLGSAAAGTTPSRSRPTAPCGPSRCGTGPWPRAARWRRPPLDRRRGVDVHTHAPRAALRCGVSTVAPDGDGPGVVGG